MQEEVLGLVLLALENGSALSRKTLVQNTYMPSSLISLSHLIHGPFLFQVKFVVQRLEEHFPQASKTSVGHVVQLLYRASCFIVSGFWGRGAGVKKRHSSPFKVKKPSGSSVMDAFSKLDVSMLLLTS